MMVTYSDFTNWSNKPVDETDFNYIEARSEDVLSLLCGSSWSETDEVCIKAVKYQIDWILNAGGLDEWQGGSGTGSSRSYSVGGESESITYMQSGSDGSGRRIYMGLSIDPIARGLLHKGGFITRLRRVNTW